MRVLVTGANGFVGQALCDALVKSGHNVRRSARKRASTKNTTSPRAASTTAGSRVPGADEVLAMVEIGDIGPETNWTEAMTDIEVVVHLAGRVHVLKEEARDPLTEFRLVNVRGTECLARAAASAGVRRLVYVSSIKVNGECTRATPFTAADTPAPQDAYGVSKWEAECALLRIAEEVKGLEIVIVRSPLVYGPGVKGNFLRMMNWVNRGIPLPLGAIRNSRSLLYLGNLADALVTCVVHPRAGSKIFLVRDGQDVSTPALIGALARGLGTSTHIFPFPPRLLELGGALVGLGDSVNRLTRSLQVDDSPIRSELGWRPPYSFEEGLRVTAEWYLAQRG